MVEVTAAEAAGAEAAGPVVPEAATAAEAEAVAEVVKAAGAGAGARAVVTAEGTVATLATAGNRVATEVPAAAVATLGTAGNRVATQVPADAVATRREATTAAAIAVKTLLTRGTIKTATGIAIEIKTATGIGSKRRTARMAWATAIAAEAWGSPYRTRPIKHKPRRAKATHRSDLRYVTPCIRHKSRRGSNVKTKRGPARRWRPKIVN